MDMHFPDRGLGFLIRILLLNNRLYYYDMYIRLALENGYAVTSYADYLKHHMARGTRVLILRHDVDSNGAQARLMFDIERKHNVCATYYFRWCTLNIDFIRELYSCGFEVGLHYETLGRYCEENCISRVDRDVVDRCRNILKGEIKEFYTVTGIKPDTVASHGHDMNIRLGVSNNILLEDQDCSSYGILRGAYDRDFYRNMVSAHISDCSILCNYGFIYNTNPVQSIFRKDKVIVFLSHPEHWQYGVWARVKMLMKLIAGRYTTSSGARFSRLSGYEVCKRAGMPII